MISINTNRYINILAFIDLQNKLTDSQLTTYLCLNLLKDSKNKIKIKELKEILNFYSNKQLNNNLKLFLNDNYIKYEDKTKNKLILIKKCKELTDHTNNLMAFTLNDILTFKKHSIKYYKLQLLKKFGKQLLIKQERLQEVLGITKNDIKIMKRNFKLIKIHHTLKIQGRTKYQLGLYDKNIQHCRFIRTMLPCEYNFERIESEKTIKDTNFKVSNEFYNYLRKKLAYKYTSCKKYDSEISDLKYDIQPGIVKKYLSEQKTSICDININTQKPAIYTNIFDNTHHTLFKLDEQFVNLFPIFINSRKSGNNFTSTI